MARSLSSTVKTLLAAQRIPSIVITLDFPSLSLRLTNWPRNVTIGTTVYTGAAAGANRFGLEFEGLGENIDFQVDSARLTIKSLDTYFKAMFLADSLRGKNVTVALLYVDPADSTFKESGWVTTFQVDADECAHDYVALRLASADVVQGTEVNRRTTQEAGCQHVFQKDECVFRWVTGMNEKLKVCDYSLYGAIGCKAHFPDVPDPNDPNVMLSQPKPYGAFLGNIEHSIVRR